MPTEEDVKPAAQPAPETKPADAATPAPGTAGTGGAAGQAAEAQPAAKPAVKATSLLEGDDEEDTPNPSQAGDPATDPEAKPPVAGAFPDDWREKLAAGNDKLLARLKRYKSLDAAVLAGFSAQDKIRSGDYKAKLSDNPSEDELKEYRAAHGIPEAPSGYEIPAVPGHQWTDADKPGLAAFTERMHKINAPPSFVAEAAVWYKESVEAAKAAAEEARMAKDQGDRQAVEDALRARLGGEYRPSINLFKRLLSDAEVFPEGMAEKIASARFDDGTRLINDPAMADFFIGMARERYGDTAFISGDAKAQMASVEEQARTIMKTDFDRYIREGWDKKLADVLAKKGGNRSTPSHYT
jgi:hypothetical protein